MNAFQKCSECTKEGLKRNHYLCSADTKDGLIVRCSGSQSFGKLEMLKYYLEIVTRAIKDEYAHLNFVDLFAGPGICRDRESGEERFGSSLIAYSLECPFTNYVFNDLDKNITNALRTRCQTYDSERFKRVTILNLDANLKIDTILTHVPLKNSLTIVLADPNGLDIHFDTLKALTKYQHLDIILNYAILDLKRNQKTYLGENDKAKLFFGPTEFNEQTSTSELFQAYKDSLRGIGLTSVEEGIEGSTRFKTKTNADIYYLLFASKHPLGLRFWRAAKKRFAPLDLFGRGN